MTYPFDEEQSPNVHYYNYVKCWAVSEKNRVIFHKIKLLCKANSWEEAFRQAPVFMWQYINFGVMFRWANPDSDEPGVCQGPLAAKHLYLQPQDFQG